MQCKSNESILGKMHTSFTADAQKDKFKQLVLVDFVPSLKSSLKHVPPNIKIAIIDSV